MSATRDCATGIWHRRTTPITRVIAKICQTSSQPVRINASIRMPIDPMMNSTEDSRRLRGNRSAKAPVNRARKFSAILAAAMAPTRNGESVRVSTNHPSTADSIWVPTPTSAVDPQTKAKSRFRKMLSGEEARLSVAAIRKIGFPEKFRVEVRHARPDGGTPSRAATGRVPGWPMIP